MNLVFAIFRLLSLAVSYFKIFSLTVPLDTATIFASICSKVHEIKIDHLWPPSTRACVAAFLFVEGLFIKPALLYNNPLYKIYLLLKLKCQLLQIFFLITRLNY